jgi:GNAT superfamily N-acetyltransferase
MPNDGAAMPDLIVTDAPDPADRDAIVDGLNRYNQDETGGAASQPLAVLIRSDGGITTGGLLGRTWLGWLYVELLYVPDGLRGSGVGRDLMLRAETEARARGCIGIWLNTFSFQARGFYEKLGFTLLGRIEDYPPGHQRFFLQKRL